MGNKVYRPVVSFEHVSATLTTAEMRRLQAAFRTAEAGLLPGVPDDAAPSTPVTPLSARVPGAGSAGATPRVAYVDAYAPESTEGAVSLEAFKVYMGPRFAAFGPVTVERLFQVLDTDGSKSLNFTEFAVAMYLFARGTRDEQLLLLFNLWDISGSGLISRKDFRQMSLALIVGTERAKWKVVHPPREEGGKEETEELDMTFFKPMANMMAEMAMSEYDADNDGKLSLEEWRHFADSDEDTARFLQAMATFGRVLEPGGARRAEPGGAATPRTIAAAASAGAGTTVDAGAGSVGDDGASGAARPPSAVTVSVTTGAPIPIPTV